MESSETAPDWVMREVLPNVEGPVRSVHMVTDRTVIVFSQTHALFGEKPKFGAAKLFRVDYPSGLFVNGANCPHCGEQILEPIGKVARLASEATAEEVARSKKPKKRKP